MEIEWTGEFNKEQRAAVIAFRDRGEFDEVTMTEFCRNRIFYITVYNNTLIAYIG